MSQITLQPGVVVVARGLAAAVQECLPDLRVRVLTISTGESTVVSLDEIEILPQRSEDNEVIESSFLRVENASNEEWARAQKLSDIIVRHQNSELTALQAAREAGIALTTFYRNLKQFDKDSGPSSLLRITRGRKVGALIINSEHESLIQRAINSTYKGKSATVAGVWREVERLCIKSGLTVPSRTAVSARLKKIPERQRYLLVHGHEAASQKFDPKPGRQDVARPLDWVQMDHTLVDVILVDQKSRLPIGRPWLTLLIDIRTRVILGYYISMYPPSTLSVASAMAHAALPKNAFLKRLGLGADNHPFYGVPRVLHLDNAKEFRTVKLIRACSAYNIDIRWRPLGKKHYGGHIERLIGTMMTQYVHFLPGTTFSNTLQRKNYDSEKHAALSFSEFCKWFAGQVAIYHGRKHSALGNSPASEWRKFFTSPEGVVQHPPLVSNPLEFKLGFMPEEVRKIHPQGISIKNNWYWSSGLKPYIGQRGVVVKYDPHSMATVWAKVGGSYIPIGFSNVTKGDFSYEEFRATSLPNSRGDVASAGSALEDQSLVELIEQSENIVAEAVKETKKQRRERAAKQTHKSSAWTGDGSWDNGQKRNPATQTEAPDYSKPATPYARRS